MKILIDLDGVVADFVTGACRWHRREIRKWPANGDICEALDLTPIEFWGSLDHDFWLDLPKHSDADAIMETIFKYRSPKDCAFLTSPTLHSPAASAKMEWIKRHYPIMSRRFLIGAAKEMCAHSGSVLVDDLGKEH